MKIFVDFDDVLFNTAKFIQDFKRVFARYGVSAQLFNKSYVDYPIRRRGQKLKKYDPWVHFQKLQQAGIDSAPIENDIRALLSDTRRYVFPEAKRFLKTLGKQNIMVVSYGETKFQHFKIQNSGIAELTKKVFVTDRMKSSAIGKIIGKRGAQLDELIVFLDDRVEQLTNVKQKFPQVVTFLVKKRAGRYNDKKNKYCDFEIKTLWQAANRIKKIVSQQ
ncbi:hypothetical protein EPO05_00315 [Patescibacteria group bacterium]|nr:MAG: hypothetical protein EPO05_00315 [Patescibacteria group bacterium]